MKFRLFIILLFALLLTSCATDDSDETTSANSSNLPWEKISWETADDGQYANFTYQDLQPSCTNAPGTKPEFAFFFRQGASDNLLVYFQGGGACWHVNNTITEPTCTQELRSEETTAYFDLIGTGVVKGLGGIFNFAKADNPFQDWSFVYIPYCSGDLFWGAQDTVYGTDTVRHRGHVNTRVVIEWMKNKFQTSPDNIFVTGVSGGAYGAMGNFPYIKEEFSDSQFYVFADAGNGVLNDDFRTNGLTQWDIQIPSSTTMPGSTFTTLDGLAPEDLAISSFYAAIANHYSTTNFGQYTTAWDNNQTYFYNVMQNIDVTSDWDDITSDTVWCDWHDEMLANVAATKTLSTEDNYKTYIAPGDVHTILMSSDMYTETSNEVGLMDWINAMLTDGSDFDDVMCVDDDCDKPASCPDCS